MAFHTDVGYLYKLICIDRESGCGLWQSEVWGDGYVGSYSGAGYFHWVAIKPQYDRVLVYGVSLIGAYIQGIRIDDGSRIFWFSTQYSDWSNK